jgi:hypothetical protein
MIEEKIVNMLSVRFAELKITFIKAAKHILLKYNKKCVRKMGKDLFIYIVRLPLYKEKKNSNFSLSSEIFMKGNS